MVTRLNVGGSARHVAILTSRLRMRGIPTNLLAGVEGESEGTLLPDTPFTRIPTLKRQPALGADFLAYRQLRRILRGSRPRVVHTHLAKAGALGRLAAWNSLPGARILHTYHGHVLDGYFGRRQAQTYLAMERWLARRSTALIAVSEAVRESLLELGIGREAQWHVIPLGFDLAELERTALPVSEARERLNIPHEAFVVGIVGRLVPIKDHETFIHAVREVSERISQPVVALVVGDGPDRARIEAMARSVLSGNVRFLGWQTDLAPIYSAVDLVCLSSRNEGTPVSLIEAGASGTAVVATDVGGVSDVVVDGVTGTLVPVSDVGRFAAAMGSFARDPDRTAMFGASARRHVFSRFSVERMETDVIDLYRSL
ncbi:MAG: glycosyltransferase [Actinomycetota bacterium]